MPMPNFRTTTHNQAVERMALVESIEVMVRQIMIEELSLWDKPDETLPTVAFIQVHVALDYNGMPFRVHRAFEQQQQQQFLVVPTMYLYLKQEPKASKNTVERCVDVLRHGGDSEEWWELHGEPPLSTPLAHKFGIEFGGEGWSVWFPPTSIDLPGKDGRIIEYLVGDKSSLQRWETDCNSETSPLRQSSSDYYEDDSSDEIDYAEEYLLDM